MNPLVSASAKESAPEELPESSNESGRFVKNEPRQESLRIPGEDIGLFASLNRWVKNTFSSKSDEMSVRDALEELLSSAPDTDTPINQEERLILKNILSFGESEVSDIMIPRSDIIAVEDTLSLEELKQVIIEERHTRLPVYRETLDDVIGFLHIKDLIPALCGDMAFDIHRFVRQILFVPPSMKVVDLLVKMRMSGVHMAIVVDEYGGTDGLVTLENLFEEIVGDIHDEHDEDEKAEEKYHRLNEHEIEVDARLNLYDLEETLGIPLAVYGEEYDVDTVGGLIFGMLGRVPVAGEMIEHPSGLVFQVLEADMRRIIRVKITNSANVLTSE
jgi:CBS domain containing-hemolysin-like protein